MCKSFAAPIMHEGDAWATTSVFDYRDTLLTLAGIYSCKRLRYRLVIMPHGSKMQTLGAGIFTAMHQASMVFAMPKTYDPSRYSKGCKSVWAIPLGETLPLIEGLRLVRAIGSFSDGSD